MIAQDTVWKVKGQDEAVIEIWEDFYGNLWFLTKKDVDDTPGLCYGFARLYHCPEFAEWGSIYLPEIKEALGENMVWQVKKENWSNINSYEKGLLVEVKEQP